jgi:hypothetical protein
VGDLAQSFNQGRASTAELRPMLQRQLLQHLLSSGSERQQNFASVESAPVTFDEAGVCQPVHQLDSAMMLDLKALRDFGNSWTPPRRQPLQCQHKLVLSRFQSNPSGILFAEVQKTPDLVPQFRKRLIIHEMQGSFHEFD